MLASSWHLTPRDNNCSANDDPREHTTVNEWSPHFDNYKHHTVNNKNTNIGPSLTMMNYCDMQHLARKRTITIIFTHTQ